MQPDRSHSPQRYRWLTVGDAYTYVAKHGKGDDERRGQRCKVITVPRTGGGPGNARVLFDDGHIAIVPAGVLRRAT